MEKELTKLDEKEEDQSAKTPNSTIKISKAEEAMVRDLKFSYQKHLISLIDTPFLAELKNGELPVLIKPPTV